MRRLVSDTLVIAERNLVRLPRAPDLLLAFTVQPVMFVLLFVYVFGGAISTPGYDYVDFLIPGIIVQNIAFGGFVTALGLNEDLHKGLIDRFRSLPMARPAVLAGRTLADVVTNTLSVLVLLVTGLIIGFNFDASVGRDRRRLRGAGAVRLRLLVGLRVARPARVLAGVGQLGRLHRGLPAHVHLARRSCRSTRCRTCCSGSRRHQPVHDRRRRDARAVARRAGRQLACGARSPGRSRSSRCSPRSRSRATARRLRCARRGRSPTWPTPPAARRSRRRRPGRSGARQRGARGGCPGRSRSRRRRAARCTSSSVIAGSTSAAVPCRCCESGRPPCAAFQPGRGGR